MGVVVIGRNEGERLRRCLESLAGRARAIVYVDSGSSDGSVLLATAQGASVQQLDASQPFTAARARNAGAALLRALQPDIDFIQFVDGDCEVQPEWLERALAFVISHADVAAVCGRRRERHPEHSVYNLLCDIEWSTPVGEASACGGDALMRADAFDAVGGFRDDLIAGEEPELCVRLRKAGWRIWRLDAEMTLHDAAMTRFGQWWRRSERTGFSFAQGARIHGAPPERHWVREARSGAFWGLALPLGLLAGCAWLGPWALLGFLVYPLQMIRIFSRTPGTQRARLARAYFLVLGKFPEASGQLRYFVRMAMRDPARLIEYK